MTDILSDQDGPLLWFEDQMHDMSVRLIGQALTKARAEAAALEVESERVHADDRAAFAARFQAVCDQAVEARDLTRLRYRLRQVPEGWR